jgi:hypothetical protein
MRSVGMKKLAVLCGVAASWTLAAEAGAQALDLTNPTARMVNVETMTAMTDASGVVTGTAFGPKVPAMLSVDGGVATVTIAGENAAPGAPTFGPIALMNGGIMVNFTNGRFDMVGGRTISIDVASGNARVEQTSMGMIDLNIMVAGLMLMQPVTFNVATVSATNLGPLFSADTVRDPNAPGVTSGAPLRIQGSGRACAMDGSGFLDPMVGVPPCAPERFANPVQLDPKPFDPMTGELTTVGFTGISLLPFTVAGAVMITVEPIQNANPITVRLSEIGG